MDRTSRYARCGEPKRSCTLSKTAANGQSQGDKETGEPDDATSIQSGSAGGWEKRPKGPRSQPTQLYGSGLRLMECVRLRVKDVDFAYHQLIVRDGKGAQDRVTMLPQSLEEALRRQLARTKPVYEEDLAAGYGEVYLPYAFARKDPHAGTSWEWQYVFPASKRSIDPRSGRERRHHISETVLQKAVKQAIRQAGLDKRGSCHTLRNALT